MLHNACKIKHLQLIYVHFAINSWMITFERFVLLELSSNTNVLNRFVQKFFGEPEDEYDLQARRDSAADIIDAFIPLMRQNKTKHRDIFQYKNETELLQDIAAASTKTSKREMRKANKKGAKKVLENEFVVVRHITTHEAAVVYGKGTKWCVSSKETRSGSTTPIGKLYFSHYTSDANLYYILCKPGAEELNIQLRTLFNKTHNFKLNDKFAVVRSSHQMEGYFADNDSMSPKSIMDLADALQIPFSVFKGK